MKLPIEILMEFDQEIGLAGLPPYNDPLTGFNLLNAAQEELSKRTKCVVREIVFEKSQYQYEGRLTVDSSADTTHFVDADVAHATGAGDNDYYSGWKVYNVTTGETAFVTDYAGATGTFTIAPPMANLAASDSYYLEYQQNRTELPFDFIEEVQGSVRWGDDSVLNKWSQEEQNISELPVVADGTPGRYTIIGNEIIVYPRPAQSDLLYMKYHAKPSYVTITKSSKVSADANEIYFPKRFIGNFPTYRLLGARVYLMDGSYTGSYSTIQLLSKTSDGLRAYVYPAFSGTPANNTEFCTLLDVPESVQDGLIHYMLWMYSRNKKGYEHVAKNALGEWQSFLSEAMTIISRRKLPKLLQLRGATSFKQRINFVTS